MTCIVGVRHSTGLYIGGDSGAVNSGYSLQVAARPKVFRRGEYLFGYTTSFRMGQLLEFTLELPKMEGPDPLADMVQLFVPALRACLKAGGFAKVDNNVETGGNFLVLGRGRVFEVAGDFQVSEWAEPFAAVGCGYELALGSLHASDETGELRRDPRAAIERALRAAVRFSAGVRGPFHIVGGEAATTAPVRPLPPPAEFIREGAIPAPRPPLPPPREIREGDIP